MAGEVVYGTTLAITKTSVLLMFHRIFPTRPFQIAAVVVGTTVIMWWMAVILVSIFQCRPVALFYDKSLNGDCINAVSFSIGNEIGNVITYVAILALPARELWKLQISRSTKFSLFGIFLMGGL